VCAIVAEQPSPRQGLLVGARILALQARTLSARSLERISLLFGDE